MDDPIFKLEKVVQTRGDEPLEDFEGPLDLILYLLGKNKIEIQDIPIALILEQYQDYLEKRKQMDLEVASEFITMAAQLMFIKTRMLLNLEDEEAQSEMDALIKSLEERKRGEAYARVRMLSERLAPLSEFGRNILTRPPEPMERGKIYEYDQEPADLVLTMQEITDRQGAPEAPPIRAFDEIVKREPYPVETKAKEILRRLRGVGITRFLLLFRGSKTRSELVATFMAVLELCRNNRCKGRHMDTLEMKDIEAAVEGMLFASGEPVAVDRICVALNMDRPTVELVLQHLQDYYSYERRGVRLLRMEDSWQLCSAPEYGDQIRKAFEIRKPAKLSQPALEVLTIIAYYQPTTRAYVDQIRGVDSSYTVGLLLDRHLIEECGRLQVPGRPRLYRTTQAFLRAFHLNSLEELPQLPGMEADGQLRLDDDTVPADGENGAEAL